MDLFISRTTLFTLVIFILLTSSDYLRAEGHVLFANAVLCLMGGLAIAYALMVLESQGDNNDDR